MIPTIRKMLNIWIYEERINSSGIDCCWLGPDVWIWPTLISVTDWLAPDWLASDWLAPDIMLVISEEIRWNIIFHQSDSQLTSIHQSGPPRAASADSWRHNWSDCYSVRPISSAARIGRRVAMQPVSCAQGKAFRVKPSSSGCCLLLHHHRLFVPRERGTPESCGAKHKSHFLEHFTTVWPNWKYDKHPDAPTSRFPIVKWKFRSTLNNFLFPKSSKQINNRHCVSVLSIKRSYVSKMASNTNQPTFLLSSNKPVHCPFSRAASQLVSLWC